MGTKEKTTSGEWRGYWEGFRREYGGEDVMIRRMEVGGASDLYVKDFGALDTLGALDVKTGVQFGVKALVRGNVRKVEMRILSWPQFEEHFGVTKEEFRAKLPEIAGRIRRIGGEYKPKDGDTVINCYFTVSGGVREEYKRIYEMFEGFKEVILDYWPLG